MQLNASLKFNSKALDTYCIIYKMQWIPIKKNTKVELFYPKNGVQTTKVILLFPNIHLKTRCVYNRDHCCKRNKEKH